MSGLAEHFKQGGSGVLATAAKDGTINTAIYAAPHVVDDKTVAWGMTEGRTYRNLKENPNAAYLHEDPGAGGKGVRMTLKLTDIKDSGQMLETIRKRAGATSGQQAAGMVKYVGYFKVVETRPLT